MATNVQVQQHFGTYNVKSLIASVSTMRFLLEIILILQAVKSHLNGQMINMILQSWSVDMKFMKRFINFI